MTAVLFDLDDTLYARIDPFRFAYHKIFGAPRVGDDQSLYDDFMRFGYDLYEDSLAGRCSMEDMFIDRIRKTARIQRMELDDAQAMAFQTQYAWEQQHLTLSKEMEAALSCLREKGYFLGIVSNGNSDHQREKYRTLKLSRWITPEHFLPTGEIGVSKPDPRALLAAQKRWQLSPDQTWYVGDHLLHDIACASSLGWHTLWLNRYPGRPAPDEGEIAPEHTVTSEAQLLKFCQTL